MYSSYFFFGTTVYSPVNIVLYMGSLCKIEKQQNSRIGGNHDYINHIRFINTIVGTSLGAACVLFMKNELSVKTTKMLSGFAAGVMIAASVWSLLIPALEQSQSLGKCSSSRQ